MTVNLDIEIDADILHVRAKGLRDRNTVLAIARKIVEVSREHGKTRVLVDVHELKGRLGTLDSHDVAFDDFPKIEGIDQYQVAIVDDDIVDGIHPFEAFSRQQGLNFRIFGSTIRAIDWLRE